MTSFAWTIFLNSRNLEKFVFPRINVSFYLLLLFSDFSASSKYCARASAVEMTCSLWVPTCTKEKKFAAQNKGIMLASLCSCVCDTLNFLCHIPFIHHKTFSEYCTSLHGVSDKCNRERRFAQTSPSCHSGKKLQFESYFRP